MKSAVFLSFLLLIAFPSGAEEAAIAIDPSHGGYDLGVSYNNLREKDLALAISKDLEAALRARGKSVYLTRGVDRHLSISDRAAGSTRRGPELFISIHVSRRDFFVLYVTHYPEGALPISRYFLLSSRQRSSIQQSKALSDSIGSSLKTAVQKDVVQREIPLPVLNMIGAPAVLIEVPHFERMDYKDPALRDKLAQAIANGVMDYASR